MNTAQSVNVWHPLRCLYHDNENYKNCATFEDDAELWEFLQLFKAKRRHYRFLALLDKFLEEMKHGG